MFVRKPVETWTAETIFALNDEAQRYRQLPECLLIRFDCGQPRNEITFAVSSSTGVELAVVNRCRKRTKRPFVQMPDGLNIVVTIDQKALRPTTTLAVDNRITTSHPEGTCANSDALHRLLNCFGHRTHTCASCRN